MDKTEVIHRIREIADAAGDDEKQHVLEDRLYRDFVTFVRRESMDPIMTELAATIIDGTDEVDFNRWTA